MPKITIVEQDLTGVNYTGDETVVYVPGEVNFKDNITPDDNNCYMIRPSADLSEILQTPTTDSEKKTVLYVESLMNSGLYVVYNYISGYNGTGDIDVSYLKDKNMYNVKYLTCGIYSTINLQKGFAEEQEGEPTPAASEYNVSAGLAATLATIASLRQDCVVLCDVNSYVANGGATLTPKVADIKEVFDKGSSSVISEYAACFYPNGNYTLTSTAFSGLVDEKVEMPAHFGYLLNAGAAIRVNKKWDSVAGVVRGVLPAVFSGNTVTLSKYDLDTDVMDAEKGGVCFNGIVDINAFGYTIWGDRTLRKNAEGVHGLKASSFLSTRLMLCDIKKRVYAAAIQNTYETNNDITWMNFKNQITSLLNVMSSDGKLDSFKITKLPSDYMSQIKCKIKLVPNMPVEDFYVYITLENAEAEVTEG